MSETDEPQEYLLPAEDVPSDVRERLHPWIEGFIGLTVEAANERVAERWKSIKHPTLRSLRGTLAKFNVGGIVDYAEGGMIRAYRETTDEPGVGDFWYLPAPLDPEEIRRRLIPSGLECNEELREFLVHFAGLAEDTTVSGDFVYSKDPWPLFPDQWDDCIDGFDEWKGSLMFFRARNGCSLLVRRDGRIGWWIVQEGRVEFFSKNVDGFTKAFNKHRKVSWPFDPYGVPE